MEGRLLSLDISNPSCLRDSDHFPEILRPILLLSAYSSGREDLLPKDSCILLIVLSLAYFIPEFLPNLPFLIPQLHSFYLLPTFNRLSILFFNTQKSHQLEITTLKLLVYSHLAFSPRKNICIYL